MKITDLLNPVGIDLNAHVRTKEEAIDHLVALMDSTGVLADAAGYKSGLLKRETEGSTAVGEGVAIPHAKGEAVKQPGLAVMVVPEAVSYTHLLGFSAGFTGQEILRRLAEVGCREEFVPIPGVSRINVKIKEQQETDINGQGPVIPPEALEQLVKKLETKMDEKDVLVLAGSIPDSLPRDVYQHLLKRLQPKKSRTVVAVSYTHLYRSKYSPSGPQHTG